MDALTENYGVYAPTGNELALIMGFGKPSEPEKKDVRPKTRGEARKLVQEIYDYNVWGETEIKSNCAMIGVPYRAKVSEYSEEELKKILDDFEFYKMLNYEN